MVGLQLIEESITIVGIGLSGQAFRVISVLNRLHQFGARAGLVRCVVACAVHDSFLRPVVEQYPVYVSGAISPREVLRTLV